MSPIAGGPEVKRAELLRRLVNLQEEERHRIARELHDQMGQHLTAFLLDLEALKGHTPDRPAAAEALQRLRDLADRMGQDVHRIAFELRPTALDDWGLQTALTNYVAEWSRRCRDRGPGPLHRHGPAPPGGGRDGPVPGGPGGVDERPEARRGRAA